MNKKKYVLWTGLMRKQRSTQISDILSVEEDGMQTALNPPVLGCLEGKYQYCPIRENCGVTSI